MSVAFAAVVLVLLAVVFYLRRRNPAQRMPESMQGPLLARNLDFECPSDYCFHLGHTWMAQETPGMARVGVDALAVRLLGKVDQVTVIGEQRWVRQGQKLLTLSCHRETLGLPSPLEGVVVAINAEVIRDPGLMLRVPYRRGWVCAIKSPEIETDERNLIQGPFAAGWMRHSVDAVNSILAQEGLSLAMPEEELLARLTPESRRRVMEEIFLPNLARAG